MKKIRRDRTHEAELDITAFMNLMIVLVPVLLLGMVFSQISVIEVKLPDGLTVDNANNADKQIELLILEDQLRVNFPQGILLKKILPTDEGEQDFETLSLVLQEVKRKLREKGIEKNAITILSEQDTDYQTIISAMDTVRSFKAIVAASVVDAALFPEISFGDAPVGTGRAQ